MSGEVTNTNVIVFGLFNLHSRITYGSEQLLIAVDRGFEPRSGQAKDYEIGICCVSAKHAALRGKRKDWLVRNHNNVHVRVERHVYPRTVVSELAL